VNVPTVSVVIPAYNAADTIAAAIQSVSAQRHVDLECLIVDDGSTDGTLEVVRSAVADDPRYRVLVQHNAGPAAARNTALRAATGEWVAFLDADDVWLPAKLEQQLGLAASADVVYTDAYLELDGRRVGTYSEHWPAPAADVDMLAHLLARPNPIPLLSVLVRRAALDGVGGFAVALHGVEDIDLWLRLAAAGQRFVYLDRPTCSYRVHESGISANRARHLRDESLMFRGWADSLDDPAYARLARARARELQVAAIRARRTLDTPGRERWRDLGALAAATRRPAALVTQGLYALSPRLLNLVAPSAMRPVGRGLE
jgi:glycosyltransferase involved in cell wall biosynthesis